MCVVGRESGSSNGWGWKLGLIGVWVSYLDCCSSRCSFRACLNCLGLVMFLMFAGIEFHVLVFRSVMCVMV